MREGRKIHSKQESVQLYESGFFGNKGLTWKTPEEYYACEFNGKVLVRSRIGGGGGICLHDLKMDEVKTALGELSVDPKSTWINVAFPKDRAVLQGEIRNSSQGLELFYSTESGYHMRDALKRSGRHAHGLLAICLLRHFMSPSSFSDFEELRELFPSSIIEASVYEINVGDNHHRNTMFWEVRNY